MNPLEHMNIGDAARYYMHCEELGKAYGVDVAYLAEYRDIQEKGDHGLVGIAPFIHTHAIISDIDSYGYGDRWCYHTYAAAKAALDAWDGEGEPQGWHRNPTTGRRRDEAGNETINW
jgi:hypothetical protein